MKSQRILRLDIGPIFLAPRTSCPVFKKSISAASLFSKLHATQCFPVWFLPSFSSVKTWVNSYTEHCGRAHQQYLFFAHGENCQDPASVAIVSTSFDLNQSRSWKETARQNYGQFRQREVFIYWIDEHDPLWLFKNFSLQKFKNLCYQVYTNVIFIDNVSVNVCKNF